MSFTLLIWCYFFAIAQWKNDEIRHFFNVVIRSDLCINLLKNFPLKIYCVIILHSYVVNIVTLILLLYYYFLGNLSSVLWCCWLGGRKGIRPEWWDSGMVICLGEVQICIWPSWCHYHSLSLASVNPDWFTFLVLPFWFRKTVVVVVCMYDNKIKMGETFHTIYANKSWS